MSRSSIMKMASLALGLLGLATSFALPYSFQFGLHFAVGSAGMILSGVLIFRSEWVRKLGLNLTQSELLWSLALFLFVNLAGSLGISWLAHQESLAFGHFQPGYWAYLQFFQILNEEIVFRSLLLWLLLWMTRNRVISSLISAAIFCVAHFVFYRYLTDPSIQTDLHPLVLINLGLFALLANWSYFHFHHIGYATALHAGWNLAKFSGQIYSYNYTIQLNEAEMFNFVEGSWLVTVLLMLAFLLIKIRAVWVAGAFPTTQSLRNLLK